MNHINYQRIFPILFKVFKELAFFINVKEKAKQKNVKNYFRYEIN